MFDRMWIKMHLSGVHGRTLLWRLAILDALEHSTAPHTGELAI